MNTNIETQAVNDTALEEVNGGLTAASTPPALTASALNHGIPKRFFVPDYGELMNIVYNTTSAAVKN